ncbi:hypothetical protein HK098_001694 [Nowakowskiella sp. JEL0407]|nr:hypothetical protein HK098_001694 [Nowakowskiella sp. JEL0407]
MSAYEVKGGKGLKLKGGTPINKKKSKKFTSEIKEVAADSNPPVPETKTYVVRQKTDAEIKFQEALKKRQKDKISQVAQKSHKERVADFNRKLEDLSEHYDIPKVGPG